MALASVLRRIGKEVLLCSSGPFKRVEIKAYEDLFTAAPVAKEGDRVIILDCSSPERTGDLEPLIQGLPWAFIDHHDTSEYAQGAEPEAPILVDPKAPSTTFLIVKLIEALGLEPTREEAELLFFGLCTDTGYFRHVDSGGAETFETAARLIRFGANPKAAYEAMRGGKSLDSRILMGHVLIRAESLFEGKLIYSWEEYEETSRFGREGHDSDSLYQLFQSIGGVEAIFIVRQESPGYCVVGFRSRDWVDVGSIAKVFGGGGHKNAAGLKIAGTINTVKPLLIAEFEKAFKNHSA